MRFWQSTWTRPLAVVTVAACLAVGATPHTAPQAAIQTPPQLPDRLTDQEFWKLLTDFSEPNGYFDSDNLVSNEDTFQTVIPELRRTIARGGVYLGVGPDQNFTYIAATEPAMAFITDIRRGNLLVQLMYKAIVELSADRADFLSRLFSRPRPAGLARGATVEQLFQAFGAATPNRDLCDDNSRAIVTLLRSRHGWALSDEDIGGLTAAYRNFFDAGPDLRFVSNGNGRYQWYPSFQELHTAGDGRGGKWSYLSSEERYGVLKRLEERNMIVPLVGNFAGPRALKSVAGYLKARGATVSVFYLSNVERYLFGDGIWSQFMQNVAAMPVSDSSTFIRSCFDVCSQFNESRSVSMLDSIPGLVRDTNAGRVASYRDVLAHSHR